MDPALKTGVRLFVLATPAGAAVLAVVTDTPAVMLLITIPGAVVGYVMYQDHRREAARPRTPHGTAAGPPGASPLLIPCPEAPRMDDTTLSRSQARLLRQALEHIGITPHRLWMHYLSHGGVVGSLELDAYLHDSLHLPAVERDRLVHTANALLAPRGHPFLPCTGELRDAHRGENHPGNHQD